MFPVSLFERVRVAENNVSDAFRSVLCLFSQVKMSDAPLPAGLHTEDSQSSLSESHFVSGYTLRPKKKKAKIKSQGKSRAQRQTEYRERLKTDPTRWEEYCRRQKVHLQNWRRNQTPEEKAKEREKNRIRNKEARSMKKNAQHLAAEREKAATGQEVTPARTTRGILAAQQLTTAKKHDYWREKQRKLRARLTEEEKEAIKAKNRKKYAEMNCKRVKDQHQYSALSDTPVALQNAIIRASPTKTPTKAAKYNAMYRVKKAMPANRKVTIHVLQHLIKNASPRKKDVLKELLHSELCIPQSKENMQKAAVRKMKESEVKSKIVDFFHEQAVDLPGKRHYSKRLKKQRKILTYPVHVLFDKFINEHVNIKVSKRTFYRCRPKHILTMKCQKFIQCLCELCENARLKFNVLKSCGALLLNVRGALDATMCPTTREWWMPQCVARKCSKCGVHLLKEKLEAQCDPRVSVTYKEWKQVFHEKYKVNRTELVEQTSSVLALINSFVNSLKDHGLHVFTSEWQRKQFKILKDDLPADTAVIVVDFAENYTCRHQREVSAVHWSYNQVTLHPVVVYKRCTQCNEKITCYFVFFSDDLNHDSNFVFHILNMVMSEIEASQFMIFSDNCGIQFKSKLPFHHMSKLASNYNFERCYFGERHGKSECDSCGGMVKSFLTQAVASGRTVLRSAKEIVCFLNSNLTLKNVDCSHQARTFHLVEESDIDRSVPSSSLKTLPGTKKVHSLKVLSSQILAVRQFSCFCAFCLQDLSSECSNKELISNFECIKWPNAKSDNCNLVGNDQAKDVESDVANAVDGVALPDNVVDGGHACDTLDKIDDNVNTAPDDVLHDSNDNSTNTCDEIAVVYDVSVDDNDDELNTGMCQLSDDDGDDNELSKQRVLPVVKRNLFGPMKKGREAFFKDMYGKLLNSTSFQDVRDLCQEMFVDLENYHLMLIHPTITRREVDKNAVQLLPPNKPLGFLPALTVGDGNCMMRSLSKCVFGHENNHLEMRCRIIAELSLNKSLYLDEDYVSVGCRLEKNKVLPLIALLSDCHDGTDTTSLTVIEDIFDKEVFNARKLCQSLGIWQLLAASNILKCCIISLYPQRGPENVQTLFGRAMLPQGMDYDYKDVIYVMWSSTRVMPDEHWVANHVVPMLKIHK